MSLWTHLFDPRRVFHRYFIHWLVCAFIPGAYFHDSLIAANEDKVMSHMNINHTEYGFLFSIAAITTVVVGPAGVIMAKVGTCTSALLCGFLCFCGSVIVYAGIVWRSYLILLFGRFLFWLFLWLLQVVQNVLTYQNFKGAQLAGAYGLVIMSCRVGGTLGYGVSSSLNAYFDSFPDMIFLSVTAVLASFLATVGFALLTTTKLACQVRANFGLPSETPTLEFASIRKLPLVCWYHYVQIGCLYGAIFPFETFGVRILQETYHLPTQQQASLILSVVPGLSMFAPLVGALFRRDANQASSVATKLCILNIGWAFIIFSFVIMWIPFLRLPAVWMVVLGAGYALNATTAWILVPDLVDADLERLSVALCYVALGLSMFVSNLVAGYLRDAFNNVAVLLWFSTLSITGLSCAHGIRLNWTATRTSDTLLQPAELQLHHVIEEQDEYLVRLHTSCGSDHTEGIEVVDEHYITDDGTELSLRKESERSSQVPTRCRTAQPRVTDDDTRSVEARGASMNGILGKTDVLAKASAGVNGRACRGSKEGCGIGPVCSKDKEGCGIGPPSANSCKERNSVGPTAAGIGRTSADSAKEGGIGQASHAKEVSDNHNEC